MYELFEAAELFLKKNGRNLVGIVIFLFYFFAIGYTG